MNFNYSSTEKLKSKRLIESLFKDGKAVSKYPLKLYFLPITDFDILVHKTGFSVPKRTMKLAVRRNQIKRLMREVFRKSKQNIYTQTPQPYALMYVYLGKDMPDYHLIDKKMKQLNQKFLDKIS